ncbi:MAG: OmpH family outer membrane protein [Deltaproteobacteria bacterium]|nr:OmpH family outer membrane protein [Deltaproteobacteria bacterium]
MTRIVTCVAVVGSLLLTAPVSAKTLKIGVVQMQRAIAETNDGKKAEARLTKLKKKLETDLNKKMKSFYQQEQQLRKQWSILKDSEKRKRAQASAKKMEDLRKEYLQAERSLMGRKTKAMMKISRKLNKIIQKIAKREGYDYIFNNAAVLWAPRHVDLTNSVIRLYNK